MLLDAGPAGAALARALVARTDLSDVVVITMWPLDDFTVENGAVTFTITGANTKEGNGWGVGPHQDIMLDGSTPTPLPGPMVTPVSTSTALRTIIVVVGSIGLWRLLTT